MKTKNIILIISSFFIVSTIYFFNVSLPSLNNINNISISADTLTYIKISESSENISNLLMLSANYIGPVIIDRITGHSFFNIFIFNWCLLILSIYLIAKDESVNIEIVILFLLINPLILISTNSLNKEILAIFSAALMLRYFNTNSVVYFLLSVFFSFLTRWNHSFVFICTVFIIQFIRLTKTKPKHVLFLLLFSISFLYPIIFSKIFYFAGEIPEQTKKGFGIISILNIIQQNFGYFLIFPVKVLFNLVGNIGRVLSFLGIMNDFNYNDHYNIALLGHQILFLILLLKIRGNNILFNLNKAQIFIWIYLILFCISGAIQYRYYVVLYFIIVVLYSKRQTIQLNENDIK